MFLRRIAALAAVLLAGGYASAQNGPQLLSVFPPGARAGQTVEVTLAGHGFDGNEKLLFSAKGFTAEPVGPATVTKQPPQGQPSATVKFKVTAPKDATGTCDVRLVTKSGLSNPRAFVVSEMAEVNEAEPNNDVGQAQKIELDTTVNGVISTPTDVDYVTFRAKAGQNVVVYCLTTSIDSKMHADLMVSGPDGKQLASNRGYRGGDAVLDFKAPVDGDYLVRVSQFAYTTGGFDHFYRLTVTTGPWTEAIFPPAFRDKARVVRYERADQENDTHPDFRRPDGRRFRTRGATIVGDEDKHKERLEVDHVIRPSAAMLDAISFGGVDGNLVLWAQGTIVRDNLENSTPDKAQAVAPPCDIAGRIAKKSERHWYSFAAKKGDVWTLEVFAERIGSPVDAYFVLTDAQGKVITEQDDGADTLSPNQFYTKSDDPGRYRFAVPADGTYKVMVSTREAGVQFGVRDQYVLRIAKEHPDFRLAVMPMTPHLLDAGTLAKGGAAVFAVYVFRFDGFNDPIELSVTDLPNGVKCPPQVIGAGQTRGVFVLTADKDAEEWEGFVKIDAKAGELKHAARPFSLTWSAVGLQANQPPPNSPMITRMDRGDGMALAVRGEAPFVLTPTETELTTKPGGKLEVTLKVTRKDTFKDAIQIFSATPNIGPRQQGNQPVPSVGTAQPGSSEIKLTLDVANALAPGTHTLILRGQSGAPVPKQPNNALIRVHPTYPAVPITVTVEGGPKKK
jgi:hypothetical protein